MKEFRFLSVLLVLFFVVFQLNAQVLKDNELVIIDGQKYIIHQVRTGETVYSISRDFRTEPSAIIKNNPGTENGINIGSMLKVPYDGSFDLSEIKSYSKGDPTGFKSYTIESNSETAYSISKKFAVSVEEIYAYNPEIQRIKKGLNLRIPIWEFKPIANDRVNKTELAEVKNQPATIEHVVVSGETLFGLAKKYKTTESEIQKYNQGITSLKVGAKIRIPVETDKTTEPATLVQQINRDENELVHVVEPGETFWGIGRRYGISETELKAANPEIVKLQPGMKLKIPGNPVVEESSKTVQIADSQNNAQQVQNSDNASVPGCEKLTLTAAKAENYHIAFFLPLFIDSNDELNNKIIPVITDSLEVAGVAADSLIETNSPVSPAFKFYGNSVNFLQFYEGVLLAVDSMQKSGMKVKLSVFDTKDNPETVASIVKQGKLKGVDLIIGPVYENVQKSVSAFAIENKIPMVSPFTPKSGIINSNPYFFQVNPAREYISEATIEMITKDFSRGNFIVVKTSPYDGSAEGQMVEKIRGTVTKSGGKFVVYDFKKERAAGLKSILSPDSENVVFIPTSDEGELSVAISNLNNLSRQFPITLIAQTNFQQRYPSIEIAHFHALKMHYINPYWVDYSNANTISLIEKFRDAYSTEPDSYGLQGFDVAWYFLNNLFWYGNNFVPCTSQIQPGLVQGSYLFKKVSASGGYMNEGVSVLNYTPEFEVKRKRVLGN
jgi:LysM repeat protein/ABC-type branched-subunit amino acid transport system substrate-binding protein